jgi:RNA polymerase sigma factor (sigma-70 family)
MAPALTHPRGEERAAEREYRRHERAVNAMLAARHRRLGADDRAEIYHEAWASVLSLRARGGTIRNLERYLVAAADKLAAKRLYGADARRRVTFDPLDGPFARAADDSDSPEERVLEADEARRLRMLVDQLDGRERAVIKLRLEGGLEPAEIRQRLCLTERQYRRTAERAGRALQSQLAALDGGAWARRQRSLLCACAFGIASPRQRERARRLVEADPFCRALMSELRAVGGRAAALVPLPAGGQAEPSRRHGELVAAAREAAGDLLGAVKQQLAGLSSRAVDASPLAGARPGAAAAVIAGCVAAGGGAYCAVEGVPDGLRPQAGEERPAKAQGADREPRKARPPAPPSSPVAPAPRRAAQAPAAASPRPTVPPPPPAREFEPVPPRPAPAPAVAPEGSREFAP